MRNEPLTYSYRSPMSLPSLSNVYIVGGSLAGLMHARVILTHAPRARVTILERSPSTLLHNQGAGIVAGADTQSFFSRYVQPGREIAVTSRQRLYLDRRGDIVPGSVEDHQQHMTSWDVLYRLLRWRVDGLDAAEYLTAGDSKDIGPENGLETNISKAEYRVGCTVNSIKNLGAEQGVEVTWIDTAHETHTAIASLVIAADGASSRIRQQFCPTISRHYAGYVALRGTVLERDISASAAAALVERFAFYHGPGVQVLGYTIPGLSGGTLTKGNRLVNWVWYRNYPTESPALVSLLTDTDGHRHSVTLPVGKMQPEVWKKQVQDAENELPPQFAELVAKTEQPFVQAITDVLADENIFADGQVLLVGDALAGFRPHTAASTSQAARGARLLGSWLEGKMTREGYREECLTFAREVQSHGVWLGNRSQFGHHPLADNA